MNEAINIWSEIGTLRRVLVHRPGEELLNLMPEHLDRLLFDDIPYLRLARQEHDRFAQLLTEQGVEVVYLEDLVAESLTEESIRRQLVEEYLWDAGIRGEKRIARMMEYFLGFSTKNMVLKMMAGVRKSEIYGYGKKNLTDYLEGDYPFVIDPMPNLYFTRDPFACIGSGVSLHRMYSQTRNRETLFGDYIFRYHPNYKSVPKVYNRQMESSLEGGDILVLSRDTVAVGISQRTEPFAIENLAKNLLGLGFSQELYASGHGVHHGGSGQIYRPPQHSGGHGGICIGAGRRTSEHSPGAGALGAYSHGSPGPSKGNSDSLWRRQRD